jgi:hypothetical protein
MNEVDAPITGKVADVLDGYTLIINKGADDDVKVGMIFIVLGFGGDVIDPDSGKSLGPRPVEKLRVKVREVYPQFSLAETYRIVPPTSVSDMLKNMPSVNANWEATQRAIGVGRYSAERERIADAPTPGESVPTHPLVHVMIGDTVRQLIR